MKTLLVAVAALFATATITASTTDLKAPVPSDGNYQDTTKKDKKKKDTTKRDTSYVQYHH
jgi:hypothetical protein